MNPDSEKEFNELFKAKEIINSEIHKNENKNMANSFSKYGLVNTDWYKDYLYFLKKPNKMKKEKLFKYTRIHPENDKRDYTFFGIGTFSFPSYFVFVTENFVNLISKYIQTYDYKYLDDFKKYLFEIAIGGDCIIMKNYDTSNTKVMYIIIYDENKGNKNNNIDFILRIKHYNEMEKALNSILKNSIWIYLKNLGFSIEENEKEIINDRGEKIGNIFRNGEPKRIEEIKEIQKMKSADITATKNIVPKFNSILMFLYISNFANELYNFSLDNKNVITKIFVEYFQNYKIDKIKSIFSKSIKIDNFEDIFDEIFEKLDLELSNKNEIKELNGEKDQLKVFKEQYKNVSIIKKLFYCPLEIKKYCPYCTKTYYKYKYKKIILLKSIDNEKENLLFEKIFKSEGIEKRERCKLCYKESKCINFKQFIFYPKILIIVVNEDQIGKFNLKKEIKNNEGISYELYCIIEANSNIVYYKNNFGFWLRFGVDNQKEEIESKIPIVLFYRLMNIKNNMVINNINNQIRNNNNQNLMINNMNNMNFMNMNNINNMISINNMNNSNNNKNNMNNMNNNINNINNINNMNNAFNIFNMNNMNNMNKNSNSNSIQPNINNNNLNAMNNKSNANNNINKNGNNLILIKFIYKENSGFINIYENQKFNDAIEILNRKYKWIKPIDNKKFYLDKARSTEIKKESTIFSLHLNNNHSIYIF